MELLEYHEHKDKVEISPYAFQIKEFEKIWSRDKREDKQRARKELTYIYMFADHRSSLIEYEDEIRHKEARDTLFGETSSWEPDDKVQAAIDRYKNIQMTPSMKLLESSLSATRRLREFFDNVDFNKTDRNGKPVYDIKKLTQAIKDVPGIIKSLQETQEQVAKEQTADSRIRGEAEKGSFEDPEED